MRPAGDTVLTGLEVAAGINQVKRQKELQGIMKGEVIITRSMSLQDKLRASGFNEVRPFFMTHRADHVKDLSSFGDLIDELDNVYLTIEGKRAPPKDPKSPKQGKRSRRHLYLFAKAMLACKVLLFDYACFINIWQQDRSPTQTSVKDVYIFASSQLNHVDDHTISGLSF